jgi:hypothetical protein
MPTSPLSLGASSEDSFDIRVLMEPFPDTETSSPSSIPRGAGDEAGASHQTRKVENESWESSMRNRILRLERDNSPYLLDKAKGEYWADIKAGLSHASSLKEYNLLMEVENGDLEIREKKHHCFLRFKEVLAKNPDLAEQENG